MTMTTLASASAATDAKQISIYEAIGGRPALVAAVENLYARLVADPALGPFFPDGVAARHRAFVVTILGEALGGPERYRGPDLAGAHRRLGISGPHFDCAAAHLAATLSELGVPHHLADQIVGIVATLRPAIVTV